MKPTFFYYLFLANFTNKDEALEWLEQLRKKSGSAFIQLLNPKYIVSTKQIEAAIYHAFRAFENKRNITKDVSTELIVRIAGINQIKEAFQKFGIIEGDNILGVIFSKNRENVEKAKSILKEECYSKHIIEWEPKLPINQNMKELMEFYGVKKENFEELTKKAIETIACVEVL